MTSIEFCYGILIAFMVVLAASEKCDVWCEENSCEKMAVSQSFAEWQKDRPTLAAAPVSQ